MAAMDVLQLLPELDPGGAERVVLALARRLPRDRFRVSVAALDGRGSLSEAFRDAGCDVHDLGSRKRRPMQAAGPLRRLIERTRPTVLHSHLFRAHLAARLAGAARRTPVTVATEHQADPRRWAVRLARWATRRATRVTAVSDAVRRHLVRHGFPPDRVCAIPNGIDPEPFDRADPLPRSELGLPDDAQVALFVGRLTRQKGVDVLLRALSALAADLPRLHVLIAGDGPDRATLQQLATRLNVADRVRFLGRRDDVPRLMATADAAVLPSRWEGLSLVLLEAMAARLPVVAAAVEGHSEVIEDGATGLLVPPEEPAALGGALRRAVTDAPLGARLGAAARRMVEDGYTSAGMSARYATLYDALVSAAGVRT